MAIEKQRLTLDLDTILPGEGLTIGNNTVQIRPLSLEQIKEVSVQLEGLGALLKDQGVTWENYEEHSNMAKIGITLMKQFPQVLEEASNIHIDDLNQLPIDTILEIMNKVVEVNTKSRDNLLGNWNSLIEKFIVKAQEKKKASPKKIQKSK